MDRAPAPPPLTPCDDAFVARLPAGLMRPVRPADVEEPRGRWQGQGAWVAAPRTTDEVAAIVAACGAARVGIVARGGGTGLVGGQLASEGPAPLILSFERMAAVRALHLQEGTMEVEAGLTLAAARAAAEAAGLMFPLSLASEGSATVGGILATNAGGVNVLRWGNARDLTLGVEAVMADGAVLHGLKRLRKDNAGYDLRHLLIGSEGTLGLITAASLRLVPPPGVRVVALVAVPSPGAALRLLAVAQGRTGGAVSAFELIGRAGFDFLAETHPDLPRPLDPAPPWSVLVELGLARGAEAEAVMAALYAEAAEAGLVEDGVIAASEAQARALWRLRETIPLANRRIGAVSSHDISLPLGEVEGFIAAADAALAAIGPFRVNCFGHLGDGNLHYNVFPPPGGARADHEHQRGAVKACVHDLVHARGGSVAAEHGVGRLKTGDLERYGDPGKLAAMRAIKAALDPAGILNPGAVLAR